MVTGDNNTIKLYLRRMLTLSISIPTFIVGTLLRLIRYSAFIQPFFIFSILFISSCENKTEDVRNWTRDITLKEEAYNIESYLSQQGIMKAKLTAPLMIRVPRYDSPYVEFPKSLHVDFYKDSTALDSWLDSKYGKYFESQNKVYLRDSVVVINIAGDTLKCQDLWWDQSSKLFYTEKYAEYRTTDKKIYPTKGLEATQDLKRVTFKFPIGTLETSNNGFPDYLKNVFLT